jgi:hypothetical protein
MRSRIITLAAPLLGAGIGWLVSWASRCSGGT